jgi:adenosylcobinamide kinase / adenosylcobinamide-phosphate guanylyltransferase
VITSADLSAGYSSGDRIMMGSHEKSITLVLGGARSGKSSYAQQLASGWDKVTFIATAQPSDDEMRTRIERHRQDRPASWPTVEVYVDLDLAVGRYGAASEVLLIDCLALYSANMMAVEKNNEEKIQERVDRFCHALRSSESSVVMVSNEVGSGVHPSHPSGRFFRDLLGRINQQVAQVADNVLLMVAGIPMTVKGQVELRSSRTNAVRSPQPAKL